MNVMNAFGKEGTVRKGHWRISIFIMLFLLLVNIPATVLNCCAGDVPEALLGDRNSRVYFGEVIEVEDQGIVIRQYQNIKGEFEAGKEETYTEFVFTENPRVGEIYLCGYLDENNPLYIWEVSSLEVASLTIANQDDMSKRMQEYLNDGSFEEAVKNMQEITEGQMQKDEAFAKMQESEAFVNGQNTEVVQNENMEVTADGFLLAVVLMFLIGAIGGVIWVRKISTQK